MKTIAIAIAASALLSFVVLTADDAQARPYCTDLFQPCDNTFCFDTAFADGCIGNPCDPRWCDPMPVCHIDCIIAPFLP